MQRGKHLYECSGAAHCALGAQGEQWQGVMAEGTRIPASRSRTGWHDC